jgi:hypothetical protein
VQLDAVRDPVSVTQLLVGDIYMVRRWLAEEKHLAAGHDHDGGHRHGHE